MKWNNNDTETPEQGMKDVQLNDTKPNKQFHEGNWAAWKFKFSFTLSLSSDLWDVPHP